MKCQSILVPSCRKVGEGVSAYASVPEHPSVFRMQRLDCGCCNHHIAMAVDMVHVFLVALFRRCIPHFTVSPCPVGYRVTDKKHTSSLTHCHYRYGNKQQKHTDSVSCLHHKSRNICLIDCYNANRMQNHYSG